MLYALGALVFEVTPFNTHDVQRETQADFAAKDVIGTRRPLEYMGEGEETITLKGKLFPERYGGMDGLSALDSMRASGTAYLLVRGDLSNRGWFVVESFSESHAYLDERGVGKMIDFSLKLKRAPAPSAASYITTLFRLLA